jgi:hypothetical protein
MAEDRRKAELIAELARARARLTANAQGLRTELDFPTKARRAFTRHPAVWIGGAALLGLLVAKLPARRKKGVVKRKGAEPVLEKAGQAGLLLGALKIAFDFARPALLKWATQRATDYFATRQHHDPTYR